MIGVDMSKGRCFTTRDQGRDGRRAAVSRLGRRINDWTEMLMVHRDAAVRGAELRQRQIAAGYSIEELEQILARWPRTARKRWHHGG